MLTRALPLFFVSLGLGCGGSTPPPAEPEDDFGSSGRPSGPTIGMTAEIGALDEGRVNSSFEKAMPKLMDCFGDGLGRISYLSGRVEFEVRVDGSGSARAVILKDSTLGDRATEDCMLNVLRRAAWPAPEGGDEGIAGKSFTFDPQGDARPPVEWSSSDLGDELSDARADLSACTQSAGAGAVKATMYVDTEGKAEAVGISTSDEQGEQAVDCIVAKLTAISYPSPGSWASKVSFTID